MMQHASLVKRIAYHLAARLPTSVDVDDLIQAGTIGLLEASRHFRGDGGASFETFAGIRIRGAMLDELRRSDWAPRSLHRRARDVADVVREIEQQSGREARDTDVARRMGLGLSELHDIQQDAARSQVFSSDALDDPEALHHVADETTPLDHVQQEEFRRELARAVAQLPAREQQVMSLYYEREMNLKEIGAVLEVSESRVCQIHGQALLRLRARLGDWSGVALS